LISEALYFLLGFLSAALLVALVAPAFWRRAVRLTRKRTVATLPMTLDEIQAEKDAVRAEFAMSTRRLELTLKAQQDRSAALAIELGRCREDVKAVAAEREERDREIKALKEAAAGLEEEIVRRDARIGKLEAELAEAREQAARRARETEEARQRFEEASLAASSRQIEIVAREQDINGLKRVVEALEAESKASEGRFQGLETDLKAALDAVRVERRKALELEKKAEGMYAAIADREETIERREKDIAQLREALAASVRLEGDLNGRIAAALASHSRLEAKLAETEQRFARIQSSDVPQDQEGALAQMAADRRRLEDRLSTLTRQNQKLRAELAALDAGPADGGRETTPLREEMSRLAAEVVHLVELLEGPQSPIRAIVPPQGEAASDPPSLADRIRALRRAAASA